MTSFGTTQLGLLALLLFGGMAPSANPGVVVMRSCVQLVMPLAFFGTSGVRAEIPAPRIQFPANN